jgi:hypothetical protein
MRLPPQRQGNAQWLEALGGPPGDFIAGLVQLAMMAPAEGHRELVTDLET